MRSPLNGIRVSGIVCLLLVFSLSAFSQTTTGRILGTISDPSGAAVAGATVVITDVQRGGTRTVSTDGSGNYAVPELQPGVYKVRAQASGFKSVERVNIVVEVAEDCASISRCRPDRFQKRSWLHPKFRWSIARRPRWAGR